MGREWVVVGILVIIVLLIATTGRRSGRRSGSTAGHYDPDAIGQYRLDPATQAYRYELPTLPRSTTSPVPGSGPPHRGRRRRRRLPTDAEGG
jgi:hypothetical protein